MLLLFKDLNMKVYGSSHSTEPLDDDDDQALDQAYLETQSKVKQFVRSIRLTQLNLHVAIEDIQMGVKTCSVASSELDPYFKLGYYTFLNGLRMYGDAYVTQPRGHLSVTSLVFSLRNTTVWKTGGSSSSWSTSRSYHFLIRGLTSVLEEMIFSASSTWMTKFPSGSSRSLPWIHLRTLATHFFQFYQWMTWPFPPIDKVGYHVFDSYIECLHSFFKYKTTHEVTPFKQRLQTVLEDFKSGSSSTTDPDPYALASKKFSETLTAILAVLDAMETH
ncbi:hypothetical protein HMI55_001043 [Coelomomyces lativittatus]|nr:hypothetical protein HMI55_001043 [Coelomomyces lativittatus]